jgi:L-aminopeptidase/D-esterase-like protein
MKQAMKAGIGSATVELEGPLAGVKVSAIAAVNAVGDIRDPKSGLIIAGTRRAPDSNEYVGSSRVLKRGGRLGWSENTTLVCVATNAQLTKVQAQKLAQLAGLGMARSIDPVNTMSDGDVVFALSIGTMKAPVDSLGAAAAEAVAMAVVRSAEQSWTLGGVPGLAKR